MPIPRITMSINLIQNKHICHTSKCGNQIYNTSYHIGLSNDHLYFRQESTFRCNNILFVNNLIKFCIMCHNITSVIFLKKLLHLEHIISPGKLSQQTSLRNQGNNIEYCYDNCSHLDVQLRLHFNTDVYNIMF